MKRKLVRQGSTTLMVSLPHTWTKRNNLQKGGEISVNEKENSILISTDHVPTKKRTNITLTNDTETSVRTAIINGYRSGYDVIRINFRDESQCQLINKIIKDYTIGLEQIKTERMYCILENITEPDAEQFEVLLRKIFYNIILLIEYTEERIKGEKQKTNYEDVTLKIHQYDNFCRRVISKRNEPSNKTGLFWTFLGLMTHGQRELYHLNRYLDKNKVKPQSFELLQHLKGMVNLLKEGYVNKDLSKLERIHQLEKELIYKKFYQDIRSGKNENIVLHYLASSIRNFYLASSPLMGLLLDSQDMKNKQKIKSSCSLLS